MSRTLKRLQSVGLSPGKLLGLQRITSKNGTFTMLALDQNSSIQKMAREALKKKGEDREPTYDEVVTAKLEMARWMGPHSTAILLDSVYGAWQSVASFQFPRNVGLLVRVEQTGSVSSPDGRGKLTTLEPGWSVEKIKRMGADAVKLLIYYEPTHPESATRQKALAERIHAECRKHDILLLLETLAYQFPGEAKDSATFLDRKPRTVIQTAKEMSALCDVYKAEFPGTLGREPDAKLQDNLKALHDASERPWVLLSAGVDYPDYKKQVEMAMTAGASGVLGGRAFWKEFFLQDGPEARIKFCKEVGSVRIKEIASIVKKNGTPWYRKYAMTSRALTRTVIPEGWHKVYDGASESLTGAGAGAGSATRDNSGAY